jgi:hypothetical protein
VSNDDWADLFRWGQLPAHNSWSSAGDLYKSFMHSASHHAYVALRDFTKDDGNAMADAGLHAGIAIEHLAKCYLATLHPILLAEKGCDIDTMLHLVGRNDLAKNTPYNIKTIGGVEACRRVGRFLPMFRFSDQADGELFITRNCASHLGLAGDIRGAVRLMIRLAEPLLIAVDRRREDFWGQYLPVANALRDETLSEQRAILEVKYEAARRQLVDRFQGLGWAEKAAFTAIMQAQSPYRAHHVEPFPCPVCESKGFLLCHREYEIVPDETELDRRAIVFNEPIAYPMSFKCGVCGLDLDETDIITAGMPSQIDLPESLVGMRMFPKAEESDLE